MCSSANHAKANTCPPFDLDKGWEDVLRAAGSPSGLQSGGWPPPRRNDSDARASLTRDPRPGRPLLVVPVASRHKFGH